MFDFVAQKGCLLKIFIFDRFAEAGIEYDDVTATLEREGVEKFAASFKELFDGVAKKRDQLVAA